MRRHVSIPVDRLHRIRAPLARVIITHRVQHRHKLILGDSVRLRVPIVAPGSMSGGRVEEINEPDLVIGDAAA